MSSLRPVITIMILAAVGVVLYMKINETPPVIPAGVGEWSTQPLEIGGEAGVAGVGATTSPPAFAAGDAPAFKPDAFATPVAPTSPGDDAPAWSPPPVALDAAPSGSDSAPAAATMAASAQPPAIPAAGATDESSPVARTADPSIALPPMPPLPSTSGDAPPVGAETAAAAPPSTNVAEQAAVLATGAGVAAVAAGAGAAAPADSAAPVVGADATTPTPETAEAEAPPSRSSSFATARTLAQGALDRGELAQALLLLSEWYGDPSLTPAESNEVEVLLSQLAGSVIYEGPPAHRLEQPYIVQSGETLHEVAEKCNVPWQLLAKINGVADPAAVQPGQELKVVRGPFSATVELGKRKMTLMLDRRYAGKFTFEVDPASTIEVGQWKVEQKLLTPTGAGLYGQAAGATEDRSLLLAHAAGGAAETVLISGPGGGEAGSSASAVRTIQLKAAEIEDVFDILSVGSRVTVRR